MNGCMNLKEKFIAIFMSTLLAFMIFPFSVFAEEPAQEQEKSESQTTESVEENQDAESDTQQGDASTEGIESDANTGSDNDAENHELDESGSILNDSEESNEADDSTKGVVPETSTTQMPDNNGVNARSSRAAKSGVSGTCEWTISPNGTLVLSAVDGSAVGKIKFTYSNGRAVAPWASYRNDIVSVRCEDPISVVGTTVDKEDPSRVIPVSLCGLFAGYTNLKSVDFTNFDLSDAGNFCNFFKNCKSLESVNFGHEGRIFATKLNQMFLGCSNLKTLDISIIDASEVEDMRSMFKDCSKLTSIDLTKFDNSSVTRSSDMFRGCNSLLNVTFGYYFVYDYSMALRDGFWESDKAVSLAYCLDHFANTDLAGTWTYKGDGDYSLVKSNGVYKLRNGQGRYMTNTWYVKEFNQVYYFDKNGNSVKHLVTIDGQRYYFNGRDFTQYTGLITWQSNGLKSYFDPDNGGRMAKYMWVDDGYDIYFVGADGYSLKYRQWVDDDWYYFNSLGQMQTGWIQWKNDGRRSYFNDDVTDYVSYGAALVGWYQIPNYSSGYGEDPWYYFDEGGYALRYRQWIDGQLYYFKGNYQQYEGVLTWKNDGRISFFDPNQAGVGSRDRWISWNGKKYYLDDEGYSVRYLQTIRGNKYYFNKACQMQTGVVIWNSNGKLSYFDPKQGGKMSKNRWISYKGIKYYLDENGYSTEKFVN